jgi:hypothetical protein
MRGPSLIQSRQSQPIAMYQQQYNEIIITCGSDVASMDHDIQVMSLNDLIIEETINPVLSNDDKNDDHKRNDHHHRHGGYGWHRRLLREPAAITDNNNSNKSLQLNRRGACGVVTYNGDTLHIISGSSHGKEVNLLNDHIVFGGDQHHNIDNTNTDVQNDNDNASSCCEMTYQPSPKPPRRNACGVATPTHIYIAGNINISASSH